MPLAFGWNAALEGKSIDWKLASQGATFVYLAADLAYQEEAANARKVGLKVGGYWTLESDLSLQETLFLSKLGTVAPDHLPPAVFVKEGRKLSTVKSFVEGVEVVTKRKTLLGGTPGALKGMGFTFGRTNPLWISHKPLYGGPSLPEGWSQFALWQTPPPRPYKGVGGVVGFNVADPRFLDPNRLEKAAWGLGALAVGGTALYFWSKKA